MPRVLAVVGAIALVAVSAAPVLAGGKPVKASDGSPPPVIYPAGEVCDFDLLYEDILNTSHSLTFPAADDGTERVLFGGRIVVRLTNLDTDVSRVYNASGPGTFIFGDTLVVTPGPWLLTSSRATPTARASGTPAATCGSRLTSRPDRSSR